MKLLVIDDDVELCELLTEYLEPEGYGVTSIHDGKKGVGPATSGSYDLVILDVMLPGQNGFETLKQIREHSSIPVLMLTARGEDVDRIVGLELGADDYLSKPFNPRELAARVRAILRRSGHEPLGGTETITVADVCLDEGSRTARRGGDVLSLTGAEFTLLSTLLREAGRVVSREVLSREALGRNLTRYDRSIDVHVSNLRKKLGKDDRGSERIRTVRGVGYLYALPETGESR